MQRNTSSERTALRSTLKKPSLYHRQSSTLRYNTFPAAPPRQPTRQPSRRDAKNDDPPEPPESPSPSRRRRSDSHPTKPQETPLPTGQLTMLAIIALAEQTALNSISPYLPEMASTFPEVDKEQVGMTLWQAILVQALMGLVNGNQGVISTCLGEITDRSNQSRAFKYLPVIYGIGGITGPIAGGLLVRKHNPLHPDQPNPYPYLLPNLFSAAVLMVDLVLSMIFLKESLDSAQELPPLGTRVVSIFSWLWQFTSSHRPTYLRRGKKRQKSNGYQPVPANGHADAIDYSEDEEDEDEALGDRPSLFPQSQQQQQNLTKSEVFNRDTILLLITFLIFQLANISYNSLYPIFAQARPPTGRHLNPQEIGISLAFAGLVTILFQVGVFGRLREKIGNKITYRTALAGFVIAFLLMPWVGYKDGSTGNETATTTGRVWLWVELAAVLIIKTVAAVGGLTSALLLITNSAPSHAVLGTLNGLAQTLSAAGRAVGPFISGSLFTVATRVQPKGEALAFGIFGGISFLGFLLSFGIRSPGLEADGWDEESSDDAEEGSGSGSEGEPDDGGRAERTR
ncbi:hypothetical protein LTR37_002741 [Vermiconidia calcicola]|uniref:Uncharacterized protein n=1 Tax=Vermiconidia calcicola TaxID=1690605 RepID=A0ACC3NRM3_9PEZI|nr:hypothetical protein LTR37_002741 [Vermiconidia calcicola]